MSRSIENVRFFGGFLFIIPFCFFSVGDHVCVCVSFSRLLVFSFRAELLHRDGNDAAAAAGCYTKHTAGQTI